MKLLHLACCLVSLPVFGQTNLPYKNQQLTIEQRVADLIARMTPEEKFRQLFMVAGDLGTDSMRFQEGLFGFQINTVQEANSAANQMMQYAAGEGTLQTQLKVNRLQRFFVEETRLGIPMIAFDEALHGLVRRDATAFPQAIALAASFDTTLMRKTTNAIALECRSRGLRMILSPVVNLATDVRWGRVEETYGEDPFLSAKMGTIYVSSLERSGIITTPKHFVVNHGEGGRDSYPIHFNERLMQETYFVPFREVIQKGGARSIMTAYNSFDGRPCTANNYLLNDVLRKQWHFRGFVISDAAATGGANVLHYTAKDYEDAGKQSIENGLDVIFQTDFSSYPLFKKPFLDGTTDQSSIDSAVAHVLRMKFELGLFDHPYETTPLLSEIQMSEHRKIAFEMAVGSAVLLKNDEQKVLPLNKEIQTIAVIGTDAVEARLGGYSGPGNNVVNLLEGIKKEFANADVNYLPGCGREDKSWTILPAENLFHDGENGKVAGLSAKYYNNVALEGNPALSRIDPQINFQWTLFGPAPEINYDYFSAEWTGWIQAPQTGTISLGIDGNDGYRFYLNDDLILDTWDEQSFHTKMVPVTLKKGAYYRVRIVYRERSGNAWFRLIWNTDFYANNDRKITDAVKLASKSDVAIVVVGIEEGEFRDRSNLHLPGKQEELIQRVAGTGKPVVVVLVGGSAVVMDSWIDKANAILDVWYPGEAGGEAVAALLSGRATPSGKLPITFPRSEGQLPLVYNHKPTGRGDDYIDGSGQPLFPFGYGLSYTQFSYENLTIDKPEALVGDTIHLGFDLKNTGNYQGSEVVQLYINDVVASVARPIKELKAFQKISLEPGASKRVEMDITPEMLTMWNLNMKEVIEPGSFRIMIGSSSKDIRLRARIELQ